MLELFAAGSVAELFPAAGKQDINNTLPIEEQINSGYVTIDYSDEYVKSYNLRNKCKEGKDPCVPFCMVL